MSLKYESLKVGEVLYDLHSHGMGNTTMRSLGVWTVKILELTEYGALVSWNGNSPSRWSKFELTKLRRTEPQLVTNKMGQQRLMTGAEKAAKKASESK